MSTRPKTKEAMYPLTLLEEAKDPNTSPARLLNLWEEDTEISISLRQAIAEHPAIPLSLVRRILAHQPTHHWEAGFLFHLGKNPGAPLELLYQAWEREPEGFLLNPLVPLLFLEHPNFWQKLPDDTLASLLTLPSLSVEILAIASEREHGGVLMSVARHPNTTSTILDAVLMKHRNEEKIYTAALQHPSLPQDKIELYLGYNTLSFRRAVAKNPSLDPLLQSLLTRLPELLEIDSSVKRPASCSLQELITLARCGVAIRKYVVTHPETPGLLLAALALDKENPLYQQIAQRDPSLAEQLKVIQYSFNDMISLSYFMPIHPNLPEELIAFYANDYSSAIRASVAKAQILLPALQQKLSQDPAVNVRAALAENPHLTTEIVEALSFDKDRNVRAAIAKHPKTNPEILNRLAGDRRVEVAMAVLRATQDRRLLSLLSVSIHPRIRQLASAQLLGDQAQDQEALALEAGFLPPEESLRSLLSRASYLQQMIAAHERTPRWCYQHLASSKEVNARLVAARSEKTPPDILRDLSLDDALLVRLSVAKNPKTPEEVLLSMISSEISILRAMAQNAGLTANVHEALLRQNSEVVVVLLAQNPNTNPAQREVLLRVAKRRARKQLRSIFC
jgi:hypothetical protein